MNPLSHGKIVTLLQYFTERAEDYWHILYPPTDPTERGKDSYLYFYDISRKALDFKGPFTDEGIYLFRGYDGRWHLHALEIAQYALACWIAWRKTQEERWHLAALRQCDWLVKHQAAEGAWYIKHKNPRYRDLPSPWPSAMAQGLAISSLLRAYKSSCDPRYLAAAERAARFLEVDVRKNGVKRTFDGGFIYEEYPRKKLNGVLNGYISAVLGLRELARNRESYEEIFRHNIDNLKKILPRFDNGFWSLYSLDGNLSSGFYHRYVIVQLRALGELDPLFAEYADRFDRYLRTPSCVLKALGKKVLAR